MKKFKDLRQKVEAKDGDGANIVKDREFKGKPSKTIPHAKPGEPGYNTRDSMFKKDGPKPAWMARKEKMKKEAVEEKTLTPAELKKREEIAKAMERDNPKMPMAKKMAIATATAKKVAEETELDEGLGHISAIQNMMAKEREAQAAKKKKYTAPTQAEIDADRKKDQKGKTRPSMSAKSAMNKQYGGYMAKFKEAKEDDEPASPDEASMALKQLEFIEYAAEEMMDHIKSGKAFPEWFQNKLSKAHGEIEGLHSAMGEHGGEDDEEMDESWKKDSGWHKPEVKKDRYGNIIKTKNVAKSMAKAAAKKTAEMPKESVQTADRKPEKYIKPDGKIGIRMVPVDKKVVDKDK